MANDKKEKIFAIDIRRATTVAIPTGGGRDVTAGDVLLVPGEVSAEDAGYLISLKKAVPCAPGLKAERAKKAGKEEK